MVKPKRDGKVKQKPRQTARKAPREQEIPISDSLPRMPGDEPLTYADSEDGPSVFCVIRMTNQTSAQRKNKQNKRIMCPWLCGQATVYSLGLYTADRTAGFQPL